MSHSRSLAFALVLVSIISYVHATSVFVGCTSATEASACGSNGHCAIGGDCTCNYGWITKDWTLAPHCNYLLRTQLNLYEIHFSVAGPFGASDMYMGFESTAWLKAACGFFSMLAAILIAFVFYSSRLISALLHCITSRNDAHTEEHPETAPVAVSVELAESKQGAAPATSHLPVKIVSADALIPDRCISTTSKQFFAHLTYGLSLFALALLVGVFIVWIKNGIQIVRGIGLVDIDGFSAVPWAASA